MDDFQRAFLVGPDKKVLAQLSLSNEEEGWFTGHVVWQKFPDDLHAKLAWYDEVLRDQMLSYLDEAEANVQSFEVQAIFPDGSSHTTYSLHISPSQEVSFRISPIAPAPELPITAIPQD
jgi:hypothetical protein